MSPVRQQAQALRARLSALAIRPRPADAVPLLIDGLACGFTSLAVAEQIAARIRGFRLHDGALLLSAPADADARSACLAEGASMLRDAGIVRGWRDEQLDVPDPRGGAPLARIERAACRTLAIATTAVHLNAWAPDGRLWVARRAAHKAIDPGCWDTLVGGMVPAGEPELEALHREAHEEAGLRLAAIPVRRGGSVRFERPVAEGFQVETIRVFDAELPDAVVPRNVDGEVDAFALQTVRETLAGIAAGRFTLEAALVTIEGILARETAP